MAKSGLMVAIGIGKKPRQEKGAPPSRFTKTEAPAEEAPAEEAVEEEPEAFGGTESPLEEAAEASPLGDLDTGGAAGGQGVGPLDVDYSDNDLCESCANMGDDGNCSRYGFPVQPTGHCAAGYEPKGELGAEGLGEGLGTETPGTEAPASDIPY